MARIDLDAIPVRKGTSYPAPFDEPCRERRAQRIGEAAGLTRLGVTRVVLPPGAWSSQRHWHAEEDEFVVVISGEVVLHTDAGEEVLRAGDCAAFPAGKRDGHCAENRSDRDAVILAMSNHSVDDWGQYPDIDLQFQGGRYDKKARFLHKDGTPY